MPSAHDTFSFYSKILALQKCCKAIGILHRLKPTLVHYYFFNPVYEVLPNHPQCPFVLQGSLSPWILRSVQVPRRFLFFWGALTVSCRRSLSHVCPVTFTRLDLLWDMILWGGWPAGHVTTEFLLPTRWSQMRSAWVGWSRWGVSGFSEAELAVSSSKQNHWPRPARRDGSFVCLWRDGSWDSAWEICPLRICYSIICWH